MDAASLNLKITTEGMDQAQRGMEGLSNTAQMLEGVIQKLVAAWATWKIAEHVEEATKLAARYETLGIVMGVMGNNAGYTSSEMDKFQTSLEKTGISMVASRQALNMMAAAQLDLTKSSELGRVAQDAAVIANINSSDAFERLVQGIQTGQAIILHHMGIMVNFEEGYKRLAPTLGKTASTLTETEKASLRLTMVMEEGAKRAGTYEAAMGTVGKQALSMERYVENLEVAFGNTFKPAYEVIIQGLTQALKDAKEWIDKNQGSIDELGSSMGIVVKQGVEFTKMLGSLGGGSDGASNSVSFLTRLFQGIGFLMAGATDILRAFAGEFISFIGNLVQKLGWVADKITTLMGYAGKGGISRTGDSIESWGNGINANLKNGGNSALTSWYDDVFGDKATKKTGRTAAEEEAAIAEGKAARAAAASAAARAEAAKAAEAYAKTIMGLNQSLGMERVTLEQGDRAAYAYSLTLKGMREGDKEALLIKWDYNKALKDQAEQEAWIDRLNHDIRSGDKARNSNAFAGRQNDLQEEAAAWDAMLQAAYPWLGEAQQIAQTQELLNIAFAKGAISLDGYTKRTADLRVAELRLKAETGDTWAIIGYTVTQNADRATDAMTRWMDNTDGLGRSWKSLGDTVRNVIADMLIQMQKAIIKQQLMQPLMNGLGAGLSTMGDGGGWASFASAFGGAFGGKKAGGGSVYSGSTYLVGEMGPELFTPGTSGNITPNHALGGTTVNAPVNISVKVESNGQVSSEASGAAAAELARRIAQEVVGKWAMEQSRPNGVLARA